MSWRPTLSADSAALPADGGAMAAEPAAALRADGITAGYGGDPVIRNVGVRADAGPVVSVVGPNGHGKSTVLKAITGVLRLLAGQVRINGRDVTGLAPEEMARAGVGYVPQVDDVFAPLTVRENLEMGGYLLDRADLPSRMEGVLAVFPRLGTMLRRPAGKLSGGERKMLAMGRVLMLRPAVFLLDEPTANLAPAIAHSLLGEHVRQLAEEGAAVLIVEQRARAVLAVSDRTDGISRRGARQQRPDENELGRLPHQHEVEHAVVDHCGGRHLHASPEKRRVGDYDGVPIEHLLARAGHLDCERGWPPSGHRPERRHRVHERAAQPPRAVGDLARYRGDSGVDAARHDDLRATGRAGRDQVHLPRPPGRQHPGGGGGIGRNAQYPGQVVASASGADPEAGARRLRHAREPASHAV